jgi:hypothetical protein
MGGGLTGCRGWGILWLQDKNRTEERKKMKISFEKFVEMVKAECSEDALSYGFSSEEALRFFEAGWSVAECAEEFESVV